MVNVSVIPSLQGQTKEIRYITLKERFLFKVRLSHMDIFLTKRKFLFLDKEYITPIKL